MPSKPTNPLVIAMFGLMLIIFGIVDMIFVSRPFGILLLAVGIALGAVGLNKYKALKLELEKQRNKTK